MIQKMTYVTVSCDIAECTVEHTTEFSSGVVKRVLLRELDTLGWHQDRHGHQFCPAHVRMITEAFGAKFLNSEWR